MTWRCRKKHLLWFVFGIVLALMMTPAQIDKAQRLAREWKAIKK